MLTAKSKLLLFFIAAFGIGIGVLSGLADGAYSAVCLFCFAVTRGRGGYLDNFRPEQTRRYGEGRGETGFCEVKT
jgi:hypothetical protein